MIQEQPIKNPAATVNPATVSRMAKRLERMTGTGMTTILRKDVRAIGVVRINLDGQGMSIISPVSGQSAREMWRKAFGIARKNKPVEIDLTVEDEDAGLD